MMLVFAFAFNVAGREGFEPPEVLPSTVFKTAAFNHSAISRFLKKIGGDTQIRTGESRLCRPTPYHLAMSPRNVVPEAGLEPARKQYPRDFKSLVSTNSTTRAFKFYIERFTFAFGAGNGFRTRGLDLGKVALYH